MTDADKRLLEVAIVSSSTLVRDLATRLEEVLADLERLRTAGAELINEMRSWNDVFQTRIDCFNSLKPLRRELNAAIDAARKQEHPDE